jgi:hypothetical protein
MCPLIQFLTVKEASSLCIQAPSGPPHQKPCPSTGGRGCFVPMKMSLLFLGGKVPKKVCPLASDHTTQVCRGKEAIDEEMYHLIPQTRCFATNIADLPAASPALLARHQQARVIRSPYPVVNPSPGGILTGPHQFL